MIHPLHRRRFLSGFVAAPAGAALLGAPALSGGADARPAPSGARLPRAKWAPRNLDVVSALIEEVGASSPGYDAGRRPYAVFDWDNTCIMNDCQESLLAHQINTLAFRMTPEEFGAAIRQNVPAGPFSAAFRNADGAVVDLETLAADLDDGYRHLHGLSEGFARKIPLDDLVKSPQFLDFRAKLYFLYEAVNDTHGVSVGYPWVTYLLSGWRLTDLARLVEESHDAALGAALARVEYASPAGLPGRAGVVKVKHSQGIRLSTEVADLMDALRTQGIDVHVCTASLEEVVAGFACNPKYGYHVPRENVFGLRLERKGEVLTSVSQSGWPLTWGPGKTTLIRQELAGRTGRGPVLVAGDSDGDYNMLSEFPDTRLGLIVNRVKKGKIGELSRVAADEIQAAKPRYILQGRQEATGCWLPQPESLPFGKSESRLLAG